MHNLGGSSCIPPVTACRGLEVTGVDNPLVKRMKQYVHTNVAGTNTIELQNLSSEVENEPWISHGDEDDIEGDDEHEDNDGNVRKEAPNNPNIHIWQPLGLDSRTFYRSSCLH